MRQKHLYEYVEAEIGGAFAKYGGFVARHRWKVLLVSVLVNLALSAGVIYLKSDVEVENVYLPQGSRAYQDEAVVERTFPDLSATNYNPLHDLTLYGVYARFIVKARSGNLLSRANLQAIRDLNTLIHGIVAQTDDGGANITIGSICARSYNTCAVDGSILWQDAFLEAVDNQTVTFPAFHLPGRGNVNYARALGGEVTMGTTGQYLQSVEYVHIQYAFRTDKPKYRDLAKKWADTFREQLDVFQSDEIDVAYAHFNSLNQELDKNIAGDISLFAITILLMTTYATMATVTSSITNQVSQRVFLGLAGVIAAGMAIGASFGVCSFIGVDFISIVGIVPFLIIGIGIDDMFILLSGLSGAQGQTTVDRRMAETLRSSGVGITITSLTDIIALLAGSYSHFLSVTNFCIYTGAAIFFCYVNNITFFAACLAINEHRVEDNRHFLTCLPIKSKQELREEGKPRSYVMCCGGNPPTSRNEAESLLDRFPRWLIPKIVLKRPVKVVIVTMFLVYLAAASYGCVHIKQGLQFQQLVTYDSYYYKYAHLLEEKFSHQLPVSFVVTSTYNYTDPGTKLQLETLISDAQSSPFFDSAFEINWLKAYTNSDFYDHTANETTFITHLRYFLNDTSSRMYENDVIIDITNTRIQASRVHLLSRYLVDSQDQGSLMMESRDIADDAQLKCFAYSPRFKIYEQYVATLGQSLQSVGIALIAVFVITCIFMPHPVLILLVTVAVLMIMAGVFGYMLYLDVSISAITMNHLIMSVGFSIDFTAHICHGYMISPAKTRDERVRHAIDQTGSPIFHGAVSSLLGIVVLAGAQSYVFRTFAAVMAFVLLFGIAHALLLLPVLLSWFGPENKMEPLHESPPVGKTDVVDMKRVGHRLWE